MIKPSAPFHDDGRAIATVDWDHDGDLDLWISNRSAPRLRLMRNDLPRTNHFIALRLQGNGTTTNRDAIGARIELILDGTENSKPLIQTLAGRAAETTTSTIRSLRSSSENGNLRFRVRLLRLQSTGNC